jgi:hypothetical protein
MRRENHSTDKRDDGVRAATKVELNISLPTSGAMGGRQEV